MEYLTIDEAAKILGKSGQTVRRMIKQGRIKAEKHKSQYGEKYMIPSSEINAAYQVVEVANLAVPVSPETFAFEVVRQLREENKALREQITQIQQQQSATLLLLEEVKEQQVRKWWKIW